MSTEIDYDLKEMEEKLLKLDWDGRSALVYQWVKTGHCNYKQFRQLCHLISVYPTAGC